MNRVLFASGSEHWSTPKVVYAALHREFDFTLDPCPLAMANGSRRRYKDHVPKDSRSTDGLTLDWSGQRVYCNPPYGRDVGLWIRKGPSAELAVFLLPARTDTRWFHGLVLPIAKEIRFCRGRLKFGDMTTGAPFPSMIVVFRGA